MTYQELEEYISKKMKMSHVYQPVMIMTLLEHRGTCHQADIAQAILSNDISQIDYYTSTTNKMVGQVLRKNGVVQKEGKTYALNGFDSFSELQVQKLKQLCQQRLIEFMESRGDSVWSHRKKSSGYISGTDKYEVLKRAKFHCELCGISAQDKALEVDHIIPRSCCGSDDLTNLQALCYSCNSMKQNKDDTDFRKVRESYDHRELGCLFCEIPQDRIIASNNLGYVIRDGFPVTDGHTLIIPKRHAMTYFDLGQAEINSLNQLLHQRKEALQADDSSITGFNIGMNCGEDAGQTIFHCHIHLIPRRKGDVEKPKGGVRHTIPGKGAY
ncbi:HIT domain-containing protein [Salinisphaera sp. G21_0]|uniref:HIT domain-containing protein n=1 Tax=Salinisphaera sp. G21_0 TaxID=2821094 RepID=UPI001ADAD3A0|nr:HIT domain-containing protein [Salinisphaera sp. G21_0]MBO9484296.1 HIT domain-containing protein [Salinisphaera sp. G21_0]